MNHNGEVGGITTELAAKLAALREWAAAEAGDLALLLEEPADMLAALSF